MLGSMIPMMISIIEPSLDYFSV